MSSEAWAKGPTECEKCKRDLLTVNPVYTDRAKAGKGWCSRYCRDGEGAGPNVIGAPQTILVEPAQPKSAPATKQPAAAPTKAAPPPKAPAKKVAAPATKKTLPSEPRRERAASEPAPPKDSPKAPAKKVASTGGKSPWSNLAGKLYKTGKTPPNFAGARKQVWELIKDGEKLESFYARCDKAGLDGKSNLAKIIGVYGCAEVK
jgi:hypothetical protein